MRETTPLSITNYIERKIVQQIVRWNIRLEMFLSKAALKLNVCQVEFLTENDSHFARNAYMI